MNTAYARMVRVLAWFCVLIFMFLSSAFLFLLVRNGFRAFYILMGQERSNLLTELLFHRTHLWHRLLPAILGTSSVIALTLLFATPLGVVIGVWSSLFAKPKFKKFNDFVLHLLMSTPSIVLGFAGYLVIIFVRENLGLNANPCLLLSTACLSLLVLPVLIRSTENAVNQVPHELKRTGISFGFSPVQNALFVILPSARRGIGRGVFLATIRAAEDTAVIMLTGAVADAILPRGFTQPFSSLSIQILYGITENRGTQDHLLVSATTLVLISLTFFLSFLGERYVGGTAYVQR